MFKKIGLNVDNYADNYAAHIKIDLDKLYKNQTYSQMWDIVNQMQGSIDRRNFERRQEIWKLLKYFDFTKIKLKPVKKTSFFDFMELYGSFYFEKFVISQNIKQKIELLSTEIRNNLLIKEIDVKNLKEKYYILFIPLLDEREIIFDKSALYEEDFERNKIRKLDIKSYDDYLKETTKLRRISYEKITLPKCFENVLALKVVCLGKLFNTKFIEMLSEKEKENLVIKDFPIYFE